MTIIDYKNVHFLESVLALYMFYSSPLKFLPGSISSNKRLCFNKLSILISNIFIF